MMIKKTLTRIGLTITLAGMSAAHAEQDAEELARQLANPVAALISVPFQLNFDNNIGADDQGERWTLNIQPVIPFDLNADWNLISRTIVPLVNQKDIFPGAGSQSGVGDIVQSAFFSPKAPTASGWIWGAGPVALLPTGSDDKLTADKWGLGPTAVALKQTGSWTYGGLANHIWSIGGDDDRADISSTFLNPFVSRNFEGGWTLGTQLEHTIDHENDQDTGTWSVFLSKVTRIGGQSMSFGIVPKYWYEDSTGSPEGFSIRASISLLFPK